MARPVFRTRSVLALAENGSRDDDECPRGRSFDHSLSSSPNRVHSANTARDGRQTKRDGGGRETRTREPVAACLRCQRVSCDGGSRFTRPIQEQRTASGRRRACTLNVGGSPDRSPRVFLTRIPRIRAARLLSISSSVHLRLPVSVSKPNLSSTPSLTSSRVPARPFAVRPLLVRHRELPRVRRRIERSVLDSARTERT